MASLPRRQDSQRRVPQREDSSAASSQHEQAARRSSHGSSSTTSAVLLNPDRPSSPSHSAAGPSSQKTTQSPSAAQASTSTTPPAAEDNEPRRCWICYNDETEDDENSSEWRSPCPCVLVAHEQCLLDWIADMEAPSGARQAGVRKNKIQCPQCKSEIKLKRPRSLVVDAVRFIERTTGLLLLPGVLGIASLATVGTLKMIGSLQILQIFGVEDGIRIMFSNDRTTSGSVLTVGLTLFRNHWRREVGVPLLPALLIASRTRLADSFLPFIPLIFFVGSGRPQEDMLQLTWPPSAAFTVATLPYIRSLYNAYYDRVWLPREQQWLKEIQPRAGADNNPHADIELQLGDVQVIPEDEDAEIEEDVLEVEIDMDIFADWMNNDAAGNNDAPEGPPAPIAGGLAAAVEEAIQQQEPHGQHNGNETDDDMPPLEALPRPEPLVDPADNAPAAAPAVPQAAARRGNRIRERRDVAAFSAVSLADTILGALVFPSIAAAVGELLKWGLPKSWTTPPTFGPLKRSPTGFLQTKWGRSILGGCLFVGVKDAVMLYVRWKMASSHRNRRVLDYEGKRAGSRGNRNGGRERTSSRA